MLPAARAVALGVLCLSFLLPAMAQAPLMPYQEYEKRIKSAQAVGPLSSDLFGESISLYNGATEFAVTDIDLPGNDALPVKLGRRFAVSSKKDIEILGGFGSWDLEVPYIHGTFIDNWMGASRVGRRCSEFERPLGSGVFQAQDFWSGTKMYVPGEGDLDILRIGNLSGAFDKLRAPTDGHTYPLGTKNFHRIRCKANTANGFPGEGFIAVDSNGTTMTFDWAVSRSAGIMEKFSGDHANGNAKQGRTEFYLMLTRTQDRFGNFVTYQWSGDKLQSIVASDGRSINLVWGSGYIVSATAHGRTWTYQYGLGGYDLRVVLPDNSWWGYEDPGLPWPNYPITDYSTTDAGCAEPLEAHDTYRIKATHPSGATGIFDFQYKRHRRTGIPVSACVVYARTFGTGELHYQMGVPDYFDVYSLVNKSVSGPGMAIQNWTYEYEVPPSGRAAMDPAAPPPCTHCQDAKSVWVGQPDGSKLEYRFGTLWQGNDGRLLVTYTRDATGQIVRSDTNEYLTDSEAATMPFPDWYGASLSSDDVMTSRIRPVKARTVAQSGFIPGPVYYVPPPPPPPTPCDDCPPPPPRDCDPVTGICTEPMWVSEPANSQENGPAPAQVGLDLNSGTDSTTTSASSTGSVPATTFTRQNSWFDEFARPTQVRRFSSLGHAATDTHEYQDNLGLWVLGQSQRSTTDGIETTRTSFDARALPAASYSFGKLQTTLGYDTSGTLATVTDGRNLTTTLSDWYRGVPRAIRYADGTTQSAVVNPSGWITRVTDENGFATNYAYDAMGRVTETTFPVGDSVAFNSLKRHFRPVTASDWMPPGGVVGQWHSVEWKGTDRKVTYYDAMWRPVLEYVYDDADNPGTLQSVRSAYDVNGRLAFRSYPSRSSAPSVQGVWSNYDALGRVTAVSQDSEHGLLTTRTEYLNGFQVRTTNPKGAQTTITNFQAFDQPTFDAPLLIVQPEGAVTEIQRDVFGKTQSLKRSGGSASVTRHYVYDGHQRLCKTIEPETRATVMDYDGAGNLHWSASGLEMLSGACDTIAARDSGRKVARTYDARNRLHQLLFPDGRGDQLWAYTPDGLPATITTWNDAAGVAPVVNAYSYNKRRMLDAESVQQPGWYGWGIGYAYDANGSLAGQRYPTGLYVDYAPNAIGQATRAGSWATGVTYYPNGAIKQFTYGNGVTHRMTQNARQLPSRSSNAGVFDFTFRYDQNGNTTNIDDVNQVPGQYTGSRDMAYDGLDRLTYAHLHWRQINHFSYDALDNIRRKDHFNGHTSTAEVYEHDRNNRLWMVRNEAGAATIALEYDVQGNLARKNGTIYRFDLGNRLRSVDNKEGYRYDGHGRRVSAWAPNQGSILSQYSQAGQVMYQHDERKTAASEHIYLGGSLVATRENNWALAQLKTRYQHTDALGSPVAVTNEVGQVVDRTHYEPFGAAINKVFNGIGYTGHVQDAATGLTYMQQRYYDPTLGRFLSVDPITANGNTGANFNRYKYANSNPYRFTDPDGRCEAPTGTRICVDRISKIERSAMATVNAIVLHRTGGSTAAGAISTWKSNANKNNVGAHFVIDKDGKITQAASTSMTTNHVGKIRSRAGDNGPFNPSRTNTAEQKKSYPDRYPTNSDSVGIEVVGSFSPKTGQFEAPTADQTAALSELVGSLQTQFGLGDEDVYRHGDISYKQPSEGAGLGYDPTH